MYPLNENPQNVRQPSDDIGLILGKNRSSLQENRAIKTENHPSDKPVRRLKNYVNLRVSARGINKVDA